MTKQDIKKLITILKAIQHELFMANKMKIALLSGSDKRKVEKAFTEVDSEG